LGSSFFSSAKVDRSAPSRGLPQCGSCGLSKKCESPKLPVVGDGGKGVLFVMDAPGDREDRRGEGFVDKNSTFLRRVLTNLGFDLEDDGWATYGVICPTNTKVTSAEAKYCRPNIVKTIRELRPKVIVPMGPVAVASVIGSVWKEETGQMERWVEWKIPCHEYNAWICPTWGPGYLLNKDDPVLDKEFKRNIRAAIELDERPWPSGPPDWAQTVRRVLDTAEAAEWLLDVANRKIGAVAWDYETNSLKPDADEAEIASCAVTYGTNRPEETIAFPWHGEVISAMSKLLRSPIPKIGANLKFEDRWTRAKLGHRVRNWVWDTVLAAHALDNRQGITSVKFQAFVRLGVPIWNEKIEPYLKSQGDSKLNRIRQLDVMDLLLYNGLDAVYEFEVATSQIEEMNEYSPWETSEMYA
jgi:uracil-DNA glycosylase family 4